MRNNKIEKFNNLNTKDVIFIDTYANENVLLKIVDVETSSFEYCRNVKKIYISANVKNIKWNQYLCSELEEIIVDSNNENYLDQDGVLFTADKKTLVGYPHSRSGSYNIPYGTEHIGNMAFKSCCVSSLILPDTLRTIGINAFYECKNLKEIILPESIRKIESNCDRGNIDIKQLFYFKKDIGHIKSYSINDIRQIVNK